MPKFDSPLTNRKFAGAPPMRHLDIPDESGSQVPSGGGQFVPSVSRQFGTPMSEQEMQDFQARMQAVQNPDMNLSEVEREMKRMRQEKIQSHQMLNEGARKRIEMLIGMTRKTRSAQVEDNVYVLQTLKDKEMREAIMMASEYDGTVQSAFEIRKQILSRSLVQVAGVPIQQFVGSDSLEAKLELIEELDDALLNRLMEEYSILVKETKEKYAIKTLEEVKEVVEDLKK
jgi:hypothetical protein